MSAIAGIYHLNREPISPEHSAGLMKVLEQYPANDIQYWQKEHIFLGCHAQWITPESVGEKLPYYDHERQLAITADAIIDNRVELFEKLQIRKSKQKKMSDSELILLAYHKWGEECPKYLIGDYAFMLWDERLQQVFGARDFAGARTLYYFKDQKRFAFCTAINPLLSLPYVNRELNEEWLGEFLAIPFNFETVDPISTVYKGIMQIPPSHSLVLRKGEIKLSRYCHLDSRSTLRLKSNLEYEEAFREVFQKAVSDRLRTHHQVGAHLSGGLDSGSIVSFAARNLKKENKQLKTFSYVPVDDFVDWSPKSRVANEKPFIQSTVNYVGNIHDTYLHFEGQNALTDIDDWLDALEMPYKFYENSFWLKGIYEKASEQGVGILLNGQRGNWTISWGPALDYQAMLMKKFKFLSLNRELQLYSDNLGINKSRILKAVRKKAYPFIRNPFIKQVEEDFPLIINSTFANKVKVFEKLKAHEIDLTGNKPMDAYAVRKTQFEKVYYANLIGTYSTKLSLKYAIWDRDPTNDLRVINFCLSLPEEQYVQNGQGRSLIRRATKNYLPDNIRLNQQTRGLQGADGIHRMIPDWSDFRSEINKLLNDRNMAEYLDLDVIKKAAENNREPKPQKVFDDDFRILMRSLILYRFMNKFA
jgi:asparagine synthase (glutamine-hydrolysing)